MNKRLTLSSLLAIQVVLALGLLWQEQARSTGSGAEPWLSFPTANVSKIVVADTSNTTTLDLTDGQWRLTDPVLPANGAKINALLSTLDGLVASRPVVNTAAGRERFEVTEQKHQRRLSLFKDDALLGEYYFGTSPAFRRTHARRADDDEVYALAFNNFDLPADKNDWLDKSLLSAQDPAAIKGPDFSLVESGGAWLLDSVVTDVAMQTEDPPSSAESVIPGSAGASRATDEAGAPVLNADAAGKLADALSSLRVMRISEDAVSGEPVVLEVKSGESVLTYRFTKSDKGYYVQRSDIAHTFTLAETDYKAIAEQTLATLTAAPGADGDADAGIATAPDAASAQVQ